jgi:arylsulfatase A-like enzyme
MKHWRGKSGRINRLGTVPLVCLALGAGAPLLQSCSSEPLDKGGSEQVGSLGLSLEVAPGVTLNSVAYTITGNGFSKTGTIDTSGSPTINGTIGGIPAGNGYTLTLTATSSDGRTTFTGSATFNVTAGKTTSVTIHLKGTATTGKGSVTVNGTLNVGPVVDELTVTPLKLYVGSTVTLSGVASDADNAPSPLSYYWSTTGGLITNPIAPNATLTSSTPGTFTVKLTVSDGEISASASTTVTFLEREAGGGGGAGGEGGGSGEGSKRPNILLIIADDYGAEAASLYPTISGETGAVPVPNIESLAANGLVFDNAWASPVCSPTRGTIVSGLYGYRTGVTTVGNVLPTSTVTLFDRLSADSPESYEQAFFGKYHLGGGSIDPRPGGSFPAAPGILQHVRDLGITNYRGILGGGLTDYFNWTTFDINGSAVANTTYATTALTDYAIDYIHQHETAKPDEPWFLYQAYNGPHAANGGNSPYQVPPPELHHVDLSSVGSPAPGTYVTNVPVYKANIQALDTEIGRLLREVDLDDTVVIFVGDNGVPDPVKDKNGGLRGAKGSAYEGGVRVPLVVTGAGVTRRGREDELFVTTDIYATVLSLAGVPVSHVNNSYSIAPLLSDEAASSGRSHSFTETSSGTSNRTYAIKDKRFKLLSTTSRAYELYDLVADPLEKTNLYANASYAAVRATLEAEIAALKVDAPAGYFP